LSQARRRAGDISRAVLVSELLIAVVTPDSPRGGERERAERVESKSVYLKKII